jgi:carboxyl-terminal processing protease
MTSLMLAIGALLSEEVTGVGLQLVGKGSNGLPVIKQVLPASPARKSGIKPGSFLLSINGTNTIGKPLREIAMSIRGKVGTTVTLEVVDPTGGQTNKVTLKRILIKIEDENRDSVNSDTSR